MNWTTKISKPATEGVRVHGYSVNDLAGKATFTDMIFLMLKGELPDPHQRGLLDAVLVMAAEHGIQVPSITAARIVQSAGNPLNASVAAGILAVGDHHGGAVEQAARVFQERSQEQPSAVVKHFLDNKQRVPGYGHKQYDKDPRVEPLFAIAEKHKLAGKTVMFANAVDEELCKQTGKQLHLNIDGAIAAIITDLGFPWQSARAFFIIPRTAGIAAHVVEELLSGEGYRRVEDKDVSYEGKADRKI